ncbi:MAG: hypothetical protein ACRDT0_24285 [Pseudonocardiaceae bacterium]
MSRRAAQRPAQQLDFQKLWQSADKLRGSMDTLARTGFTGLLDVLQLPEAHSVVVPTLGHMSSHELVREALVRMVKRTGAQLIVLDEANASTASGELEVLPLAVRTSHGVAHGATLLVKDVDPRPDRGVTPGRPGPTGRRECSPTAGRGSSPQQVHRAPGARRGEPHAAPYAL